MAGSFGQLETQGVLQLAAALGRVEKRSSVKLREAILAGAEPVRVGAERHAVQDISHVLSPTAEVDWWRMRVGATSQFVYVAPKERGNRGGRKTPRFGAILVKWALTPAADEGRAAVVESVGLVYDRLISEEGF